MEETEKLQKEIEKKLCSLFLESEEPLKCLFSVLSDSIISMNSNGRIVGCNKVTEKIFQYFHEELVGMDIRMLIPSRAEKNTGDLPEHSEEVQIFKFVGRTTEYSALRKNGEEFPIELSLFVHNYNSELIFTALIKDLAEQRKLKGDLEQKNKQLAEANKLKGEFLANASHELRTPLNSSIGFLKLILDGLCENRQQEIEFIKHAYENLKNLLQLINDILDISKIEAGKMALELEAVNLEKLFNDLYILTHLQAKEKNLKLIFNLPQGQSLTVRADYNKLKQILLNLLSNSIKFTEKGYIAISAVPHSEKGYVLIEVVDTGIGISEDKQKKLFQKFVQADGSMTRKYGGTGLGLTITKSLVKLMGGIIKLESEGENKGTKVWFTIPIFVSGGKLEWRSLEERREAAEIKGNKDGPLVLIVEDDSIFRNLLEDVLHEQGYGTIFAVTADDAVASARKFHPDAITLDYGLLADEHAVLHDGWDIIKTLQEDDETKDIRLLVISGYDEPLKEKLLSKPLYQTPEFLQKPFNINAFIEKIKKITGAVQKSGG